MYDDEGQLVGADGYDEHAAAVTTTAAVLTGAGYGTVLSRQTETPHRLPYGYTQSNGHPPGPFESKEDEGLRILHQLFSASVRGVGDCAW
ncbi:hypothetical protein [Streptomyces sp. NPDC093089]|uniref:hypothetical protein n=1 Tax=Streptomyces sp. NPDC093089 TaxID=3366024 RepID=UPI00382A7F21